ncbi:MAG: luciferase family protein [Granulosicoccus sp.]
MAELRRKLIRELEKNPDIDVHLWKPDSDLTVIDYKGKEIAHFHGNNELDIRLSREIVKRDGLTHDTKRVGHLNRKNGGRWLIVCFTRSGHLPEMMRLLKLAIDVRSSEAR